MGESKLLSVHVSYMYSIFCNAHHLFDRSSHRHILKIRSLYGLYYSTTWNNHVNPVDFFVENENNVISWTSKISSLVRRNKSEEAIGFFKTLLVNEQKVNYVTMLSLIRAAGVLHSENMIRVMHGFVIKLGLESEVSVVTALLSVYVSWDMDIVFKLFEGTWNKDVVLWSAMVSACVRSGMHVEAFNGFREMQYYGVKPNHVTIVTILPACADLGALWFGKEIHGFSLKALLDSHTNIQNALVHMYAKCRKFEASAKVFGGIQDKDLISWRTMISGCMVNEHPRKALNVFLIMRFCSYRPDENSIQEALTASIQARERNVGFGLHCLILKSGFISFVSIVTGLLHMYAKFGNVGHARSLFIQLQQKDFIVYSAMISAYAQSEFPFDAFIIFKDMQLANQKPNEITFVSLLHASTMMADKGMGESIHGHMKKAGYSSNTFLASALIDLYCKYGSIRQAKAIFDEMPGKDLICWSSMINGYGINGYGSEALETFSNMLNSGIMPNDAVFVSVLSACSHCGLDDEGWDWFYAMEEKFHVSPKLAHYACMVDMLSRRGYVKEALKFVNKLPIEPDIRIWGALLAGCRKNSDSIEVAEVAVHRLIGLDPENTSYHVFLSNLYAEQNRWEDVNKLRSLVEEKGLTKDAGCSIVATNF